MKKIIGNKIKCKKCGDVIESVSVHDFKFCKCGVVAVDVVMTVTSSLIGKIALQDIVKLFFYKRYFIIVKLLESFGKYFVKTKTKLTLYNIMMLH